jgi:ribosomal protein S18 acetylase RimI-like enzyme
MSGDVTFRDATPADAAVLADLGARTFADTFGHLYRPEDLAAFLAGHRVEAWAAELADPAFAVRIGEAAGEAVAYAKMGPAKLPITPPVGAIELRQFYVLATHHGVGVAPVLMDWVLATARARGATAVYLSVFIDNARARRFYERYGFRRIGTYAFMVGNHADEDDLMVLDL